MLQVGTLTIMGRVILGVVTATAGIVGAGVTLTGVAEAALGTTSGVIIVGWIPNWKKTPA